MRVTALMSGALNRLGINHPRIAVSGLNPHAGESGLFGSEEREHIIPAVEELKAEGMGITGPFTAWMIGRFGARLTMSIGGLIIAVATFLLGLAGHIYPIYLVLCLFTGLGLSLASMIPVQTVVIS